MTAVIRKYFRVLAAGLLLLALVLSAAHVHEAHGDASHGDSSCIVCQLAHSAAASAPELEIAYDPVLLPTAPAPRPAASRYREICLVAYGSRAPPPITA